MLPTTCKREVYRALQTEMDSVSSTIDTSLGKSIPVQYDNVSYESLTNQTYVRFNITFSASGSKADGVTDRQAGIATAQVFTPAGGGIIESSTITDLIEGHFKGLQWAENVLVVRFTTTEDIGQSGGHFQANVNIYFDYYK